jgi:hypothetical protein
MDNMTGLGRSPVEARMTSSWEEVVVELGGAIANLPYVVNDEAAKIIKEELVRMTKAIAQQDWESLSTVLEDMKE